GPAWKRMATRRRLDHADAAGVAGGGPARPGRPRSRPGGGAPAQRDRLAVRLDAPGLARAGAAGHHPAPAALLRRPLRAGLAHAGPGARARAGGALAPRPAEAVRRAPRRRRPAPRPHLLLPRGGIPGGAPGRAGGAVPAGTGGDRDPPPPRQ